MFCLNSNNPPKEILLVDDFSDDEGITLGFLRHLKKKYKGTVCIQVITLDRNFGPGGARNAGWEIASQPYIALLDSDDAWHCDKLSIQYLFMKQNIEIAITGHKYIISTEVNKLHNDKINKEFYFTKIYPISLLFKSRFPTSSVMIRADLPLRFPLDQRAAEDTFLWQKASLAGFTIIRINVPLVYYFKSLYGAGGLSKQLVKMELGELGNFIALFNAGDINFIIFLSASIFSLLKFLRRCFLTYVKNVINYIASR